VAPEWKPTRWWRLRGSYSYLQVELKKAPNSLDVGTIPGIEGSSPQHQVSVQSGFDLSRTVNLDVDYRYISALPGQLVPSYSTADARVAWRMSEHFQASIAGRNLLQPHHPEFAGDPGPLVEIKRSVYGQITWKR